MGQDFREKVDYSSPLWYFVKNCVFGKKVHIKQNQAQRSLAKTFELDLVVFYKVGLKVVMSKLSSIRSVLCSLYLMYVLYTILTRRTSPKVTR